MNQKRLNDWIALCAYLERCPYNASYDPKCQGAYLLNGPCPAEKFIWVDDPDQGPRFIAGRAVPHKKQILNPNLAAERERAKFYRQVVKERRSIGLVFWSTGHGWRLHKGYQEVLAKLQSEVEDA